MPARIRVTQAIKSAILQVHTTCYVCDSLGIPDPSFAAYEPTQIQCDHWTPVSLIGDIQADLQANLRPLHAYPGGLSPVDDGFDQSTERNCHKGKGNKFKSGQDWIRFLVISRKAKTIEYSDDFFHGREEAAEAYNVEIEWGENQATWEGNNYSIMKQTTGSENTEWKSFSALVPSRLLWHDRLVQTRSANKKRLATFGWHLIEHPLLSSVLCRYDSETHRLWVFDGNHRLCSLLLARGLDVRVPVTIFHGPDHLDFLEVVKEAHDVLTQMKYQYSEKAMKYSAIAADEFAAAVEQWGDDASEVHAWDGLTGAAVKLRIKGKLTQDLGEQGDWRNKWLTTRLTDASWQVFLEYYSKVVAETAAFKNDVLYLREQEQQNMIILCTIFDEELFDHAAAGHVCENSLKTKWWKLSHKIFRDWLKSVVKHSLQLANTPEKPAYTQVWNQHIQNAIRQAVRNWRVSPAWTQPTVANNEPEVLQLLTERGFTETYLGEEPIQ